MQLEETVADLAPQLLRYCLARTGSPSLAEDISQEAPATETPVATAARAEYHLSNRDGLLVLESRNGRYLAISGDSELQPMARVN